MKRISFLLLLLGQLALTQAQSIVYPYSISYISLAIEGKPARMAYMDVRGPAPGGETVLLLHGKNFNGYYWKDAIAFLVENGYRVVVPDQVGWGLSDKPDIHYSFHLLASNTRQLLDTLGVPRVHIIGHSMGGMLAARFALMYPERVGKLIFENPIGLEDYRTFVPYRALDSVFATELNANFATLKKYQQSYYPEWKPEYEQYVTAQFAALQLPDFQHGAWASALSYQMIFEQPVVYELENITRPTLIIIGQEDRTVLGKSLLTPSEAAKHGNYPQLGRWLNEQVAGSKLVELRGVGHIPHIQEPASFHNHVLDFLKE